MSKLSNTLYKLSRDIGKASSVTRDVEDIIHLDFSKLIKRHIKKEVYKETNKVARRINNNF